MDREYWDLFFADPKLVSEARKAAVLRIASKRLNAAFEQAVIGPFLAINEAVAKRWPGRT